MANTLNRDAITRAQALEALDEPANNKALAGALFAQMKTFGAKLQNARRKRLVVYNEFEQVAAEALVKAITEEADLADRPPPPAIEIVRAEKN